ncbi:MAG: hypothetical protein AAF804_03125, partial [Bacteroidota bacterium]
FALNCFDIQGLVFEAECAEARGETWQVIADSSAANGAYLRVAQVSAAPNQPPTDSSARLKFTFEVEQEQGWKLFARVKNPDNFSDTYWVKVNQGDWEPWEAFLVGDFVWYEYANPFNLRRGPNAIEFAYRDPKSGLDQLLITNDATEPPTGMLAGGPACYWTATSLPPSLARQTPTLTLAPNPSKTTATTRLFLSGFQPGEDLQITLLDSHGKRLHEQLVQFLGNGQELPLIPQGPAGWYLIRVTSREGSQAILWLRP